MTQQSLDTTLLENLDLAPECEAGHHDKRGEGPATWIAWCTSPFAPCGCPRTCYPMLVCDACFTDVQKLAAEGYDVNCPTCKETYPARLSRFVKKEPIAKKGKP